LDEGGVEGSVLSAVAKFACDVRHCVEVSRDRLQEYRSVRSLIIVVRWNRIFLNGRQSARLRERRMLSMYFSERVVCRSQANRRR